MTQPGEKWWPPNGYLSHWILDQFPKGYRGYAIDVGASDGKSVNTTWALERGHGWTVISVEPNPAFHPYLIAERAMVEKCACGDVSSTGEFYINVSHPESFSSLARPSRDTLISWAEKTSSIPGPLQTIQVQIKTVDEILARWEFPRLDALCIDVEGTEVDVLNGANLSFWKPKVIITEWWLEDPQDLHRVLDPLGYELTVPGNPIIRWRMEHPNHLWVLKGEA